MIFLWFSGWVNLPGGLAWGGILSETNCVRLDMSPRRVYLAPQMVLTRKTIIMKCGVRCKEHSLRYFGNSEWKVEGATRRGSGVDPRKQKLYSSSQSMCTGFFAIANSCFKQMKWSVRNFEFEIWIIRNIWNATSRNLLMLNFWKFERLKHGNC